MRGARRTPRSEPHQPPGALCPGSADQNQLFLREITNTTSLNMWQMKWQKSRRHGGVATLSCSGACTSGSSLKTAMRTKKKLARRRLRDAAWCAEETGQSDGELRYPSSICSQLLMQLSKAGWRAHTPRGRTGTNYRTESLTDSNPLMADFQ